MPLEKATFNYPLSTGVDTKTDPKQTQKLLTAENVVVQATGEVQKRLGTRSRSNSVHNTERPDDRRSTPRFEDAQYEMRKGTFIDSLSSVMYAIGEDATDAVPYTAFPDVRHSNGSAGGGAFSYIEALGKWIPTWNGTLFDYEISRPSFSPNIRNSEEITDPSVATAGGYRCVVAESQFTETSGTVVEVIEIRIETDDGVAILHETSDVGNDRVEPKTVVLRKDNGAFRFYIFWRDVVSNEIKYQTWDTDTPEDTFTAEAVAGAATTHEWDVIRVTEISGFAESNAAAVIHKSGVNNFVRYIGPNLGLFRTTTLDHATYGAITNAVGSFEVKIGDIPNLSGRYFLHIVYQDAALAIIDVVLDAAGSVVNGPVTVDAAEPAINQITGAGVADFSETTPVALVAWEGDAVAEHNKAIIVGDVAYDGSAVGFISAAIGPARYPHGVLTGRAFLYRGRVFLPAGYVSADNLQNTTFILEMRPVQSQLDTPPFEIEFAMYATSGKILASRSSNRRNPSSLSNTNQLDNDVFEFATLREDRLRELGDIVNAPAIVRMDFDKLPPRSVEIAGTKLLSGSLGMEFDSGQFYNNNFHLFPEELTGTSAAGALPAGTYNYKAVFAWTDKFGQIHRSAPSPTYSITTGVASEIEVIVPLLLYSEAGLGAGRQLLTEVKNHDQLVVELYRTEDGGSTFYNLNNIRLPNLSGGADTINFFDEQLDSAIVDNPTLYTTGGVVPNNAPKAPRHIAATRNRVFYVSYDEPTTLFFSKAKVPGVAVSFVDEFNLPIEEGGEITGLATLDDTVIVFKRNSIYAISGSGPNDLNQGAFSAPRRISTMVGCRDTNSTVTTGEGVFFQSGKGIYLLTRSLQTVYIGAPVEDFNDREVRGAHLLPEVDQVRFLLGPNDPILVYDYFHQIWTLHFPARPPAAAGIVDGKYATIGTNGTVSVEAPDNLGKDDDDPIPMLLDTGWIKPDIQGYQRMWWVYFLGEFENEHRLKVSIFYDYEEIVGQVVEFNTETALPISGTPVRRDQKYQLRIKPKRQKCMSIRFRIEDVDGKGDNVKLSTLSFVAGAKPGRLNKTPARKVL